MPSRTRLPVGSPDAREEILAAADELFVELAAPLGEQRSVSPVDRTETPIGGTSGGHRSPYLLTRSATRWIRLLSRRTLSG